MASINSASVMSSILPLFCLIILLCLAGETQPKGPVRCGRPNLLFNEFPWVAHLLVQNPGGKYFTCGGTLISDQHILTAAHCVVEDGTDRLFSIINITLGSRDVSPDSNDRAHQQILTWKVLAVPEVNANLLEHDIAVILLSKPAILNDYVQPACLPFAHDPDQVNESVVFTGWGQSTGAHQCCLRESSPVLRRVNTTVISSFGSDGHCQQTAGVGPFSGDNVICTDGSQNRRFCYGDDGGPLNYYNPKLDRWFVVGIAGRANSASCRMLNKSSNSKWMNNETKRPNLLTRVRSQLDFIRDHSGVIPPSKLADVKSPATTTNKKNRLRQFPASLPETKSTAHYSTTGRPPKIDVPLYDLGEFSCMGKSAGNYPTASCSPNFFMCSQYHYHTFTCAKGLVYRPSINACDWPSNVPGCSSSESN